MAGLGLTLALAETLGLRLEDGLSDALTDTDGLSDALADREGLVLGDLEADGDTELEADLDGLMDALADRDGLILALAEIMREGIRQAAAPLGHRRSRALRTWPSPCTVESSRLGTRS